MIYTVTLNPALDKTVVIPSLRVDAVNRITSMRTDPGGKGINVSKVISKLGGESIAAGILGGDTGRAVLSALEERKLATCFHFAEGETRTNMKIIDPENHTNTDINEPGMTVSGEILGELLEELLAKADYVSLHCPLTPQTRYLINRKTIQGMKDGVYLVNTSRGGLIDTQGLALYVGLEDGLNGNGIPLRDP